MVKRNNATTRLLTEVELELMNILWRKGEGSVSDVIEELPEGRDLAYTSVSTILRILEQKEILKTRKEGRGHIYIPAVEKSVYERSALSHMLRTVFNGSPLPLVKQLLSSKKLTPEDLQEIQKLFKEMGKKS